MNKHEHEQHKPEQHKHEQRKHENEHEQHKTKSQDTNMNMNKHDDTISNMNNINMNNTISRQHKTNLETQTNKTQSPTVTQYNQEQKQGNQDIALKSRATTETEREREREREKTENELQSELQSDLWVAKWVVGRDRSRVGPCVTGPSRMRHGKIKHYSEHHPDFFDWTIEKIQFFLSNQEICNHNAVETPSWHFWLKNWKNAVSKLNPWKKTAQFTIWKKSEKNMQSLARAETPGFWVGFAQSQKSCHWNVTQHSNGPGKDHHKSKEMNAQAGNCLKSCANCPPGEQSKTSKTSAIVQGSHNHHSNDQRSLCEWRVHHKKQCEQLVMHDEGRLHDATCHHSATINATTITTNTAWIHQRQLWHRNTDEICKMKSGHVATKSQGCKATKKVNRHCSCKQQQQPNQKSWALEPWPEHTKQKQQ